MTHDVLERPNAATAAEVLPPPVDIVQAATHVIVRDDTDVVASFRAERQVGGRVWLAGAGLKLPVAVAIDGLPGGSVVALQQHTGIHGVGASLHEALDDIRAAMRDHERILTEAPALSEDLREQLAFLRLHLAD